MFAFALLVSVTSSFITLSTLNSQLSPNTSTAHATTSSNINFQARLLTAAGAVAPDGVYNVQFNLYYATGGSIWTETYLNSNSQGLVTTNGYLSTSLGSLTPFSGINWDQDLYIGMTVRGTGSCAFGACTPTDGEMTPRMKVTASPYAFTAGNLKTTSGANTTTVDFITPTGTRTINLPDETGTVCTTGSVCSGYAPSSGSGSYIQNGTSTQTTANFNIQSAAAGSIGGIIRAATSQTADLLDIQNSAGTTNMVSIGAAGATAIRNDSTSAFSVQNAAGSLTFLNVDTTNQQLSVRNKTDAAVLGSDIAAPATGTGTNWTGTGPYTHTTGSTAVLTFSSPAIVANTTYEITYTTAGTTTGEKFTPTIGGVAGGAIYGNVTNQTQVITTTGTSSLLFTPTSNATGTITLVTLKIITNSTSALVVKDQNGIIKLEVRASGTNTGLGLTSLQSNTSGINNTATGQSSLQANTTGYSNTAIGSLSLKSNTTGVSNTAIGHASLQFNTTGYGNTAIGSQVLFNNTTGLNNTTTGHYSLQSNTTGSDNTANGRLSLSNNTTGLQNTAIGAWSLYGTTTGSNNNAFGYSSLYFNATGSGNSGLGTFSDVLSTNLSAATVIGYNARVGGSNSIVLGRANIDKVGINTVLPTSAFQVGNGTYTTGTICQNTAACGSAGATTTTVTGVGTTFTANMVGGTLLYSDGTTASITAFGSTTSLTVSPTKYIQTAEIYTIIYPGGFNVSTGGAVTSRNLNDSATAFQIQNATAVPLLTVDTTNSKLTVGGDIIATGAATGTTGTTEATARTNVTTVTLTAAGSFANNDIIFINNAGQDYYTRIVSGGGTTTLTVSPAVSYDVSASVTKYLAQNLGATTTDYTTQTNRFFQGYFTGGIVTGAGSTSLSDQNLTSTGNLYLNTNGNNTRLTVTSAGNIGIGDTTPAAMLTVGNGDLFQVNSSGAIVASTGMANSGAYIQSGASANTLTGATTISGAASFTAAGTGLAVTNNATIGGTLVVTGATTLNSGLSVTGGRTYLQANNEVYSLGVRYNGTAIPMYIGATNSATAPDMVFSNSGGAELMRVTYGGTLAVTGTVTGGTYNGQTISSAASFTGTVGIASNLSANGGNFATARYSGVGQGIFLQGDTSGNWYIDNNSGVFRLVNNGYAVEKFSVDQTGSVSVKNALSVAGNTTMGGTLAVTGTVTGGTYNGQTISAAANFTGTMGIAGNTTIGTAVATNTLRYLDLRNDDTGANAGVDLRLVTSDAAGTGTAVVDMVKYKSGGFVIANNEPNVAGYIGIATAAGPITSSIGGSEKMRIQPSGNVGIGTAAPGAKLDVNGQIAIEQKNFGGDAGLLIKGLNSSSNWPNIGFSLQNGAAQDIQFAGIATQITNSTTGSEAGDLMFATKPSASAAVERVRILSTGNVGIGTTAPGQKLDVQGGNINTSGSVMTGGTARLDSSGNLSNIGTITSGLINGQTISAAANFTGTMAVANTLTGAGEIRTTNANAFRMIQGSYGSFFRNDGTNTLLLLTASGDQYGTWNSLRPLYVFNSTGDVYMANGQVVVNHSTGTLAVSNNITVGSTLVVTGTVTGGTYNGQTINTSANFTGTLGVASNVNIGGGLSGRRLDVYNAANNGDGLAIGQDADNTQTIQGYIDNQWAARATYAGGCCNGLKLQPDVGYVKMGSSFSVDYPGNVTGGGTYNGQTISSAAQFTGTVQLVGTQKLLFTDADTSNNLKVQLWSGYGFGINGGTLFSRSQGNIFSWRNSADAEIMNLSNGALTVNGNLAVSGGNASFLQAASTDINMNITPGSGTLGKSSALYMGATFGSSWGGGDVGARNAYRIRGTNTGANAWETMALAFDYNNGDAGYVNAMTMLFGGNVGIGTSAPTTKLQVAGNALFKNTTDTTTAFTVQNAAGTPLLTVDTTTNNKISVGAVDSTGVLFVLDTKNTSGDPTGTNGAMYYNSNAGKFRCYQNGAWYDCINAAPGAWTSYTPTVGSCQGSLGAASASGSWTQTGKTVSYRADITITNNGSAWDCITATLPASSVYESIGVGRESAVTGFSLTAMASSGTTYIRDYGNNYPGGTGRHLVINGTYETN